MKRIMFVDDEPCVLEGIRRVVRPLRAEWHVDFAGGGEQALALAQVEPYDVVISDMKMPGMSGAEVLRELQKLCPGTVRIILSGQADREQILQAIPHAQQFLSKPCSSEQIIRVVRDALTLGAVLGDPVATRLCSSMGSLPSLPATYIAIGDELSRKEPGVEDIARIVAGDIAMCAKVLQLVNSSFFGLARAVHSPTDAVGYLGIETMRSLALQMGVFSQVEGPPESLAAISRIGGRSSLAAALARRIGRLLRVSPPVVEAAFTGALLSGVGYVVLAHGDPVRFTTLMAELEAGTPALDAELKVLSATTPALGAYLLGLWGLPVAVIEVVARHREPPTSDVEGLDSTTIAHVAFLLALHGNSGAWRAALDTELVARKGLEPRLAEIGALMDEAQ